MERTALLLLRAGAALAVGPAPPADTGSCFPAPHMTVVGAGIWKSAQAPSPHARSAAACCDYCSSLSKAGVTGQGTCKAFTYEPSLANGSCFLKDNLQTSRCGLGGCISGSLHKLPPPSPPWVPPGPVVPIPRACEPPHDKYPFCNPKLALEARVDDLIQRLTLAEKPFLLIARESPLGNISRLGIPEYDWGGNCIHGVQSRCGYGSDGKERCPTSYPDPNFLGASFNKSVWLGMGKTIGVELRSLWLQGIGENHAPTELPHIGLDCWSPNVGINRDPRWGRNMEVPSEDPLLNGYFGEMYSVGMQNGTDPRFLQGIATLKHFDANQLEGNWPGPESECTGGVCTRHTINASISKYDWASSYLPAFQRSVVQGGAQAVMCSYNSINGVPSCANELMLGQILRKKWGFTGMVTSDSGAVADISSNHHYAPDLPSASVLAISAGCDVESAGWGNDPSKGIGPWATGGPYIDYLPKAVTDGKMKESVLDEALRHTVGLRFRLGLFDPSEDQPYWHVSKDVVGSAAHVAAAKDAASQGMVLLRNERRTLPLSKAKATVAIGPMAEVTGTLIGNYFGQICPDSYDEHGRETFNCVQTLAAALNTTATAQVTTVPGLPNVLSNSTAGFAAAIAAAKAAEQVVLYLGIDGSVEGEGRDRHFIGLPDGQLELAKAVLAACPQKPVVVVLINGGQLAIDWLAQHAPAIIEAWYPGIYGGEAVASAVFGDDNRFGKTPVTIYGAGVLEELNMLSFDMGAGAGRGYRYYDGKHLLYPYGFGLSYTNFTLAEDPTHLHLTAAAVPEPLRVGGTTTVTLEVRNVGKREGDEVIMAFFLPHAGTVPASAPAARLKQQMFAFERVSLAAGGAATLKFSVTPDELALYSADGDRMVYPGKYTLKFSNGVDASVTKEITVATPTGTPLVRETFL